ncbi:Hypothetical protein D9617_2g052030 [Elsinoe fawcettii]|nr:Hypothetical protein D9617_2g052030 [Elsinoe fawcettii]
MAEEPASNDTPPKSTPTQQHSDLKHAPNPHHSATAEPNAFRPSITIPRDEQPHSSTDDAPSTFSTISTTTLISLNYTIRTRPRLIWMTAFTLLTILDSCIAPIALYFSLRYATDLPLNTVFSIVTGAIGGFSIFEYMLRSWRLWKSASCCRPVGANRWVFDFFHWVYTFAWLVCMVELVVGSVPDEPYIRLIAMVPATFLWVFGVQFVVMHLMGVFGIRSPVRMSSQPSGSVPRNPVFTLVEDIVAVDGNAGTEYRERLAARYAQSEVFRRMMGVMALVWGYGAVVMATVTTVLCFTLEEDYAYTQGWSVPFVWAAIWTVGSWFYVHKMLKIERETWDNKGAHV